MNTNKDFESAKNKLAMAKENETSVVLTADEAAALHSVIGSMHLVNFADTAKSNTYTPKTTICTACYGSGYYDSCDANGNNIRCSDCKGEGHTTVED